MKPRHETCFWIYLVFLRWLCNYIYKFNWTPCMLKHALAHFCFLFFGFLNSTA